MEVKVVERTIVEADLHLGPAEIDLCFTSPYEFAELISEQLRPLMSAGKPLLPTRKPKPASHITIGKGKTVRRGRKPAVPKAPAGAKALLQCPACSKQFKTQGRLNNHQRDSHSGQGSMPASSIQPATAAAAA